LFACKILSLDLAFLEEYCHARPWVGRRTGIGAFESHQAPHAAAPLVTSIHIFTFRAEHVAEILTAAALVSYFVANSMCEGTETLVTESFAAETLATGIWPDCGTSGQLDPTHNQGQ
jgi:hypothetical protein